MKKLVTIFVLGLMGSSVMVACKKDKEEEKVAAASDVGLIRTYFFDTVPWSGSSITVNIPNLTNTQLENDAFLQYAKISGDLQYAVPGPGPNGGYVYRSFYRPISGFNPEVQYVVRSHNWDGTSFTGADSIHQLKIVHIESVKQDVVGMRKLPNDIVREQLESDGVDINDYNAVCRYYGIDPR